MCTNFTGAGIVITEAFTKQFTTQNLKNITQDDLFGGAGKRVSAILPATAFHKSMHA